MAFIKSSAEFVRGFVPPDYVIDGLIQRRFVYGLTAKTGVGKTAVAMLFAAHIDTGRSLCGLDVEKGDVLYLAGENPTDIQMRWLGLTKEMGIDPATSNAHFIDRVLPLSQHAEEISKEIRDKKLEPALIVVDTMQAFFEGDSDNDNVQAVDYARLLRSLTMLPSGPAVLILCHPTKRAADDDLIPKGGGNFLNEIDGNIGLQKRETLLVASVQGKFRGREFDPLSFQLKAVKHPVLKDARGRDITTVVATPLDAAGRAVLEAAGERDEDRLLRVIEKHPRAGLRGWSATLGWKHHSKVQRVLDSLAKRKLIKQEGRTWLLTQAGQKELNAQEGNHSTRNFTTPPPPPRYAAEIVPSSVPPVPPPPPPPPLFQP